MNFFLLLVAATFFAIQVPRAKETSHACFPPPSCSSASCRVLLQRALDSSFFLSSVESKFYLNIRQDLLEGQIHIADPHQSTLISALIAQAELGDANAFDAHLPLSHYPTFLHDVNSTATRMVQEEHLKLAGLSSQTAKYPCDWKGSGTPLLWSRVLCSEGVCFWSGCSCRCWPSWSGTVWA